MITPALHFGPLSIELRLGDVLEAPVDVLCCPVDTACDSDQGLFGVLHQRKAFSSYPMGRRRRLQLGEAIIVPMANVPIKNAALLAILNQQTITVNRESVQTSLKQALHLAETEGYAALATPFLGHVQLKLDYDLICGLMLRTMREFGLEIPKHLRQIYFYTFNSAAHIACQKQFFTYEQVV